MELKDLLLIVPAFVICELMIPAITQVIKKWFKLDGEVAAAIVSVIFPIALTAGYCVCTSTGVNAILIVGVIGLIMFSTIGATQGYDFAKKLLAKVVARFTTQTTIEDLTFEMTEETNKVDARDDTIAKPEVHNESDSV